MSDVNPNEFITVHHPETGGTAEVTRFGYANLWKAKGWVSLEDEDALDKVTSEKLDEIAADRGVDTSGAKTKAEKAKAIKEGVTGAGNNQ